MKLSITQPNLNEVLSKTIHAVPGRPTLPILSNFKLETKEGMLYVTATNLELTLIARTGCKIEQDGVATVPAKMFAALVATLPDELVTLETDGGKFSVKCQALHTSLPTMDAKDFPPIREVQGIEINLPVEELSEAIKRTLFCVSRETLRPVFTGVNFLANGKKLQIATADGCNLAVYSMPCEETFNTIIPSASMARLAASIGKQNDDIIATVSTETISFHLKDFDLITLPIQGIYPEYGKLIPTGHENACTINRERFLYALRTAMAITASEFATIRMHFNNGKMAIDVTTETSEHHDEIEASVSGKDGKIAMNGRFIEPFLAACSEPNVILETTTPSSPCVMRGEGNKDYVFVTMPIFVRW